MRMGVKMKALKLQAAAEGARGGRLRLCSGEPPADTEAAVPEAQVMAELLVREVRMTPDVTLIVGPMSGTVVRRGEAAWWRLVDAKGATLLEGTAGLLGRDYPPELTPDALLERVDLHAGDVVTRAEFEVFFR